MYKKLLFFILCLMNNVCILNAMEVEPIVEAENQPFKLWNILAQMAFKVTNENRVVNSELKHNALTLIDEIKMMPNKDINFKYYGETLLGVAMWSQDDDIVKALLDTGANPNIPSEGNSHLPGSVALHYVVKYSVGKLLLEYKADPTIKNAQGFTPFHRIYCENNDWILALREAGGDINAQNNDGNTPLHIWARHHNLNKVEALINEGADACIRNNAGETAFEIALDTDTDAPRELLSLLWCAMGSP